MAKKPKRPTPRQILAARIRSAAEAYERKYRKGSPGLWILPPKDKLYKYLSKKFHIPAGDLHYFFTYSRECTHQWNEGACHLCPAPEGTFYPEGFFY